MKNRMILAICVVLFANSVFAQCRVVTPCVVVQPVNYTLINQGIEKSRFYVTIKFSEVYHNVPVINGNLPVVYPNKGNLNDLVLDYQKKISYTNAYGGEYIEYVSIKSQMKTDLPTAVRNYDYDDKASLKPKPVIKNSNNEIENLLNKSKKTISPIIPKSGIIRPSDNEIDNLLRKPSTVKPSVDPF